jgi:polyisoprenoid-binding protein YceI
MNYLKNAIYKSIVFSLICFALSLATEYQVDKSQNNMVKFISDAPLDDFEGVTNKIDGYIFWEGDDILNGSEMYFEVDLNSIDTGIGLRNRHMRENYLETDKYPFTHFTGKLTKAEPISGDEFQVTAQGTIFIHGVNKEMVIEGKMLKVESGFQILASFVTPLSEYHIKIPQLMFFKIDENIKVELDFFLQEAVRKDEGEAK